MNFAYYFFLLLIIFLLLNLAKKNINYAPTKIKIYMNFIIGIFIVRYVILFILCLITNSKYVQYLKSLIYLNYLAIPLITIALAYVYFRWDKLSFRINYIISLIMATIYSLEMYMINGNINFSIEYGYIVMMKNETIVFTIYFIILAILLVFCIYYIEKPNANKLGIYSLILSLIIVIIENILFLGGISLFPYPIISDGIFVLLMNLGINTFKSKVKN